jgi:hypothetical protein
VNCGTVEFGPREKYRAPKKLVMLTYLLSDQILTFNFERRNLSEKEYFNGSDKNPETNNKRKNKKDFVFEKP